MRKRILSIALVVMLLFSLAGCGISYQEATNKTQTALDYGNGYFTILTEWNDLNFTYRIVYANDTKVKYFIVRTSHGIGITPLYDSDGTLQVYDEKENDNQEDNKMKLFKNKKTGEMYAQLFDGNSMAISMYNNQEINLDEVDVEEVSTAPVQRNTYKVEHIIEEDSTAADLTEREYHLKDVIHIPVDGNDIAFRVEHIEEHAEFNDVYFVAVDAVGRSSMNDMEKFLDDFEDKLPQDLVAILSDIEHVTDKRTHVRKVALLSLANVGCDDNNQCIGKDDIKFDGLQTEAERCKNLNGETYWYWLDTEYVSPSAYFLGVSGYGGVGDYGYASIAYGVCPCFSIKQRKHTD